MNEQFMPVVIAFGTDYSQTHVRDLDEASLGTQIEV